MSTSAPCVIEPQATDELLAGVAKALAAASGVRLVAQGFSTSRGADETPGVAKGTALYRVDFHRHTLASKLP